MTSVYQCACLLIRIGLNVRDWWVEGDPSHPFSNIFLAQGFSTIFPNSSSSGMRRSLVPLFFVSLVPLFLRRLCRFLLSSAFYM